MKHSHYKIFQELLWRKTMRRVNSRINTSREQYYARSVTDGDARDYITFKKYEYIIKRP